MPELELPPPLDGLSDDLAFVEQPPTTTRDAVNVRSIDPVTGRTRIAQRSGLSKYLASQVHATKKVSWLEQITSNRKKVTYSLASSPVSTAVVDTATPDKRGASVCYMSPKGDLYVLGLFGGAAGGAVFWRYNLDGFLLSTTTIPVEDQNDEVWAIHVDEFDDVFVAVSDFSTALTTARPFLWRFKLQSDGTHEVEWSRSCGGGANDMEAVQSISVKDNILYTTETDRDVTTPTAYLRTYHGIRKPKAPAKPAINQNIDTDLSATAIPFDHVVKDSGETVVMLYDTIAIPDDAFMVKYTPFGELIWTVQSTVDGGALGMSVVLDSVGDIYSMGVGPSNEWISRWDDAGTTVAEDVSGSWPVTDTTVNITDGVHKKIYADAFDNIHAPLPLSPVGASTEYRCYDSTGALVIAVNRATPFDNIAIPPTNPEYDSSTPDVPEFVWGVSQTGNISSYRLADAVAKTGSSRITKFISVAAGEVRIFDDTTLGSVLTTMSTTSDWYMSTVLFGNIYILDGISYMEVDPVAETAIPYVSHTSRNIPERCLLMTSWNGRMVLARDPDDPHNWHMSASGDQYDWDTSPPTITAQTAVSGNSAEGIGLVPDIINTLIPYSNDILVFGCDSSIYMLRGDPMAGGVLDRIPSNVGMAFGKPWAKGPEGHVFFFGARGGIYVMDPIGGQVNRLTSDTIERRMQDLNLSTFFVRLAWNWRDEGLHVMVMPYGTGGTLVQSWFWDQKNNSWWEDEFGTASSTTVQPTSVMVADGDDPDDRVLLFGTEGGYIQKWDESAVADDGTATDARILYGPFAGPDLTRELKLHHLTAVLADDLGGCNYEVFVNDRADVIPATPAKAGVLVAGRNERQNVRARGMLVLLKLRSADLNSRFAVETLMTTYQLGARMRVRS